MRGSGKKLATFTIAGVVVIATAILLLNACGAQHVERVTVDIPASNPTPSPSDTQSVTPAMSPTPNNAVPRASTEETVVKSPKPVLPDSQERLDAKAQSTSTPTLTKTLPGPGTGNGIGSGTGYGTGPGNGGGTGVNRTPRQGNPADFDFNRVFGAREVDQRVRILEKPEPGYTEAARRNDINGTVVLTLVFTAGGQVTDIKVIHGLPDGLTERAIAAAERITFTPALIFGRPVSMRLQLAYNFNLY